MKEIRHLIENRVWYSKWYKWISLLMFLILLFCFFFKCCSTNEVSTIDNIEENNSVRSGLPNHNNNSNNRKTTPISTGPNYRKPIAPHRIDTDKSDPLNREFVNDLINVYLKDTVDILSFSKSIQTKLAGYNLRPVDTAENYKRIQFEVDKSQRDKIILAIKEDSLNVKFATKEWLYYPSNFSININDPDYSKEQNKWFYQKIGVFEAWKFTTGNPEIKIAVLDSGFDLNHNELKNKYSKPWNIFEYNNKVISHSHGTHVAGTIIGEANNNFGISGVAPDCTFIPVQISDENGYITISAILDGVFYALKNKAEIINLSIALSIGDKAKFLSKNEQINIKNNMLKDEEKLWEEVFEIATENNTIIVQAAGNDGILSGVDPMKRNKFSLVVGALNKEFEPTSFTNTGEAIDVYVPGEDIYSSMPNNKMDYQSGTSMASPILAGSIALIKDYKPALTTQQIISLIKNSVNENKVLDLTKIFNS